MAIKKTVKSTENNEAKKGITPGQDIDYGGIPDFDDDFGTDSKNQISGTPKLNPTPPPEGFPSWQSAFLAAADQHPCYGNLVNPPSDASHWHARQVQAELKVVLRGFSNRNKWWNEDRANKLIQSPCGLQENGYILCWVVNPDDFESYLLLEDIREHMKYAFGDRFIVRPVSELSEDAKGWKFVLGA